MVFMNSSVFSTNANRNQCSTICLLSGFQSINEGEITLSSLAYKFTL